MNINKNDEDLMKIMMATPILFLEQFIDEKC